VTFFDEHFTAPLFGFKDRDDYYHKASCYHRIPSIKIPTLFMNSYDDPIVRKEAIGEEVFKINPNVLLATN
jgi:predicted alpha/beta-fold hydrolase